MALVATLQDDLKTALRSRDELRVSTIRLVLSAINYARIDLGHELNDEEALLVLNRQAKQRRESIEQYQAVHRQDLVDREAAGVHGEGERVQGEAGQGHRAAAASMNSDGAMPIGSACSRT